MKTQYLTREELRELTGGATRRTVLRWLRENRWAHAVGLDGWPRVLRKYHDERLCASGQSEGPRWERHVLVYGATP